MAKKYSLCQSCTMPLKNGANAGTEKDGSKSSMYCHYCYKDGEFTSDMTMEEMKDFVDKTLKDKGWIKPLRWFTLMQFPGMVRWKKN